MQEMREDPFRLLDLIRLSNYSGNSFGCQDTRIIRQAYLWWILELLGHCDQ